MSGGADHDDRRALLTRDLLAAAAAARADGLDEAAVIVVLAGVATEYARTSLTPDARMDYLEIVRDCWDHGARAEFENAVAERRLQ